MRVRCASTVATVVKSSAAACLFVRPAATRPATRCLGRRQRVPVPRRAGACAAELALRTFLPQRRAEPLEDRRPRRGSRAAAARRSPARRCASPHRQERARLLERRAHRGERRRGGRRRLGRRGRVPTRAGSIARPRSADALRPRGADRARVLLEARGERRRVVDAPRSPPGTRSRQERSGRSRGSGSRPPRAARAPPRTGARPRLRRPGASSSCPRLHRTRSGE